MRLLLALMGLVLCLPVAAVAQEMDELFPDAVLAPRAAESLLTAEMLGPPAELFDSQTVTESAVDPLVARTEELAFGKSWDRVRAPDALRRYGALMMPLWRTGRPLHMHSLFVADHVGLTSVPHLAYMFARAEAEPAALAEMVRKVLSGIEPNTKLALVLQRDESLGLTIGTVWSLDSQVVFAPFPRAYDAGEELTLPGVRLNAKVNYSLWMTRPGVQVLEVPIRGPTGEFDLALTMPDEPGAYRITMSVQKKRRLPDHPFFFSVYVGEPVPTAFTAPFDDVADTLAQSNPDVWEARVTEELNAAREAEGLTPLAVQGGMRERLRAILEDAPRKDLAAFRFFSRELTKDPLPGEPHGLWHPSFCYGFMPSDAVWMSLSNPISRASLLHPETVSVGVGALREGEVQTTLFVAMEPPPDGGAVDEQAFAMLAAKAPWDLKRPEQLEAALSAIAQDVADGTMPFPRAMKKVTALFKKTDLVGGRAQMGAYTVIPGDPPAVDDFELAAGATYLAIGNAVGDLGQGTGIQYTVLVIISSTQAK